MHIAKFEVECKYPEIIKKAVEIDDTNEVSYSVIQKISKNDTTLENKGLNIPSDGENIASLENGNKSVLLVEVKSDCLKSLMKISYSVLNRVQLSKETTEKFDKE